MYKNIILLLTISLSLSAFKVKTHVAIGRNIISEIGKGKYKDNNHITYSYNNDFFVDMKSLLSKVESLTKEDIKIVYVDDILQEILNMDVGKILFYYFNKNGKKKRFVLNTTVEVVDCIKKYPEYFMAGNVGPDGFPDIFTGQMATHISNFESVSYNGHIEKWKVLKNTCEKFKNDEQKSLEYTACEKFINNIFEKSLEENELKRELNNIPYKYRKSSFWRSIDWGQYLVEEATAPLWYEDENRRMIKSSHPAWKEVDRFRKENPNSNINKNELAEGLRCQAISFSYGYLNHMTSDAFSHQFVNILSGGAWDYTDGLGEEIKHVAVEGYIDHLLRPWLYQSPSNSEIKSKINIVNPFIKVDGLKHKIKGLYPEKNLPLFNIKIPVGFLVNTLMSKEVADAAPLSYHIKLFRYFKEYLSKFEEKLAYGDKCEDDSDCGNNSKCLSIGYCKRTSSYSYNTIYDECDSPSLSAYVFNECLTIGRLGKKEEFQACLYDLRDYLIFSYLKEVEGNIDNAMRDWLNASNDMMRNEMLQDMESSDYRIEGEICNDSSDNPCNNPKHYSCIDENCVPKTPSINSNESLNKYLNIMNSLLKTNENSSINKLFSTSCSSIARYNYVNICETVMAKLKIEVDEFKGIIRAKLKEKMLNYLKPVLKYTIKIKKLVKQYKQPDEFLKFAYCGNVNDFKNYLNSCELSVKICEENDIGCEVGKLYINELNCSEEIPKIKVCNNFIKARKKIIAGMGLLKNGSLYKNSIMQGQNDYSECYTISTLPNSEFNYKCWHRKLLDTGRRYSFMKFNNRINHEFYFDSPFQKSYFIFNSIQFGKLVLIEGYFKEELFVFFNKYGEDEDIGNVHYSESSCSKRKNYAFESIAALDGSKDIDGEENFKELNKSPRFCLLMDKDNHVNSLYDRLFMALPDYNSLISDDKYSSFDDTPLDLINNEIKKVGGSGIVKGK